MNGHMSRDGGATTEVVLWRLSKDDFGLAMRVQRITADDAITFLDEEVPPVTTAWIGLSTPPGVGFTVLERMTFFTVAEVTDWGEARKRAFCDRGWVEDVESIQ